ncbi:hypothetical protein [Ferrimonas futtsuensis]|uniref:hypothetical protein n=1 Tax=Ferrimonas futtsuensis TaxID=364764 RepID=UPI00146AABC2|nr:hypothetical protein [Ferrimonas futtsuensis]
MADFVECMRLRAKAAEDIYFAEYNRKLIEALHEKQARDHEPGELKHPADQDVIHSDR